MNNIFILSHFHKDFIFNEKCDWIIPACSGDSILVNDSRYLNVCADGILDDYKKYYSEQTLFQYYRALGAEASVLWLLKNIDRLNNKYFGFSSYRRYLYFFEDSNAEKILVNTNKDVVDSLTSDSAKVNAEKILETHDIVLCRERTVEDNLSIENQYLRYQLKEMWDLFKTAIVELYPKYANKIHWFSTTQKCSFESPIIAKKEIFKELALEYFSILEYVWQNCSDNYPDKSCKYIDCREEYPWRYPGFLGERFFPFFAYANDLNKKEVPLVLLQ